jgi:ABC-type glycerol-3-phosphate transport system substrate-binding protein
MKMLNSAKKSGFLQTKITYDDYVSELFTKRKCLFTVSSTAGLSYNYNSSNPFKIGVAKIPHADGKDFSCINQGPSVCILDHKDENRSLASYLFWKHLTNKANSSSWALDTGYMGIRNSSYQSEEYIAAINDKSEDLYKQAVADNLKKIVEVSSTTFNTPVFRGSSNARKNVGLLLSDCLLSNDIDNEIDDLFAYYSNDAKQYLND